MADPETKPDPAPLDWSAARRVLGKDGLLSVVMPAYHLADTIADNVRNVHGLLQGRIPFEIIVVDDGSGDGTAEAIETVAKEHPETIHPLVLAENTGKGNALRRGFARSRGSFVLLLDADLDLLPDKLPGFFDILERDGADIVIGSKRHPDSHIDYPWRRRLASGVYHGLVRLLIGLTVTDSQTGMKLFRREALKWSFDRSLVKRYAFDIELLSIARSHGYKISEAPIQMNFGEKIGALSLKNVRIVLNDTLAVFYRLRLLRYYQNVEVSELSDPPPRVSVVIACPGPTAYLTEALDGIARQTLPPAEVIVLPDDLVSKPLSCGDVPVRVIPTGKVRPAEKRNQGIREATGDIVAFLDDDASPQPQWLANACRHFSRPKVGATGGPGITPLHSSHMAALGGDVYASPLVSGGSRFRYVSERFRKTDDLPSCNLLVRTSLLREIGGYNTRYWPGEDTILCLDIVQKGYQIIYDPWAIVYHHRRPLFGPHLRQLGRYGKHRGYFARVFPQTSRRISYMIPSLFVLGVVFGAIAAWFLPVLRIPYLAVLAFYGIATFLAAFHRNPIDWILTWLGIVLTHVVYGVRFLQGLLFGRMPTEVRAFDHPSEVKKA